MNKDLGACDVDECTSSNTEHNGANKFWCISKSETYAYSSWVDYWEPKENKENGFLRLCVMLPKGDSQWNSGCNVMQDYSNHETDKDRLGLDHAESHAFENGVETDCKEQDQRSDVYSAYHKLLLKWMSVRVASFMRLMSIRVVCWSSVGHWYHFHRSSRWSHGPITISGVRTFGAFKISLRMVTVMVLFRYLVRWAAFNIDYLNGWLVFFHFFRGPILIFAVWEALWYLNVLMVYAMMVFLTDWGVYRVLWAWSASCG